VLPAHVDAINSIHDLAAASSPWSLDIGLYQLSQQLDQLVAQQLEGGAAECNIVSGVALNSPLTPPNPHPPALTYICIAIPCRPDPPELWCSAPGWSGHLPVTMYTQCTASYYRLYRGVCSTSTSCSTSSRRSSRRRSTSSRSRSNTTSSTSSSRRSLH
jgi:hypothetical protein